MLNVYNSFGKKTEPFRPVEKGKVRMYVCGITPYDHCHLGHARTYVAFDVIRRYLRYGGYDIFFVQNVTDVDDKIIDRAKETGENPLALSRRFDEEGRKDMKALGIMDADAYPRASEHIPQIAGMIEALLERGYAYRTETGVYFEVGKFKGYGKLSGQSPEQMAAGTRIEVDETKRNPADFALWKNAKEGEISFPSPWGAGRPGWHIECSAMSLHYIKGTIDIHGGARDLIFPHHENEIAQSEGATGKKFVRYWLHTGFLTVNGEKMAKSLGNFMTVKDMLREESAGAIRLFFGMRDYKSPLDFSKEGIAQARASLQKIWNAFDIAKRATVKENMGIDEADKNFLKAVEERKKQFIESMDNDFDTPDAIASIFGLVGDLNNYCKGKVNKEVVDKGTSTLSEMLLVIGIEREETAVSRETMEEVREAAIEFLMKGGKGKEEASSEVKGKGLDELMGIMINAREMARKRKDYATSDEIRKRLLGIGVIIEDTKEGTVWKTVPSK
jgi:cysteinyl-tRNA synthetase